MTETPPFVLIRRARGTNKIAYYRRNGARTRIAAPDGRNLLPGDAGFMDAYNKLHRAHEATQEGGPRDMAALVALYLDSHAWRQLRPASHSLYRRHLDDIRERYGAFDPAKMPRSFLFGLQDRLSRDAKGTPTPWRANEYIAVLRLLLSFGVDRGWLNANPALRMKKIKTGSAGYPTWTADEFHAFMQHPDVGEPIKRAAALAYFTGLRISDCVSLSHTARKGNVIEATPGKTARSSGAVLFIPVHPYLAAILDAAPASDAPTLLTRAGSEPWKVDTAKRAMANAVRHAGLTRVNEAGKGLSFHGLRKGLTAALAETGASDAEIESIVPHADPNMTRHYRRQADQRLMAERAIARLRVPEMAR
jgi:integrase